MEIWIPLIYPILIGGAAIYFFRHKVLWWEAAIPMGVAVLFIATFRFFVITVQTNDTEYWGGTVEKVEYYESWNEYIHRTCTQTYKCGKSTCTRTYDCSYVKYHSAYWKITDNNGVAANVSKSKYNALAKQFQQQPKFVDMHRDFHTEDGDKYQFFWQGERETYEPMTSEHSYENRVQAAHSVYSYPEVTEEEAKRFQLYDYPSINKRKLPAILSHQYKSFPKAEKEFTWLNSSLGKKKELRTWVLLYKEQPPSAGQMQERYWKGGNKNEFVICIGVDADEEVDWCHVFSWSEAQEPKITVVDFVTEQKDLDLIALADFTYKELDEKFVRKHFEEFSYLTVEPPSWAIWWCHILTFIITLLITFWSVNNEHDHERQRGFTFRRNNYDKW